ncbi:MAG TPA: BREX-2 system adenine-specific DNA-methyltransferase PglX [Acidimicrobiales bacterium]|nr:BREX-2 system adenine-specific DNA-methyltransferase PglX [Acidimicrobiales bacterium]
MISSNPLLGDLQAELPGFVADLAVRVAAGGEVRARLESEWRTAFDANRTGRSFEEWLDDRLTQVAVGWLLACVFVRFCEDNRLLDEPTIAGPGERGAAARAAQQRYFAERPHDSDRDYLHWVFRTAAALPGLGGILGDGDSPLWLLDPPADACTRLLALLRKTDEAGVLVHDFTDPTWSTRFLGDLYQDLSQHAKDTYALLQTPDFVEEFILDRTLTPALETFGLARTTLIDPTCGSGHFLLDAFHRLLGAWRDAEPGTNERELAQRALDQVTGVDLNPFAASIAHFRLLVAALKASNISRLADAPDFRIDIAVGDSLLWGARPGQLAGMEKASTAPERIFLYRTEHADHLQRIFNKTYAAVVGNPPYIIARDKGLNAQYRARYPEACRGKYSLAAPFMQCFFELADTDDGYGRPAGYVGMITANSFMKREFGKNLIEKLIPNWDLTHVIDTSGAYIPGHGTPTVILFGRNQPPVLSTIRSVLGIRGEPGTPADPAEGHVWRAITSQVNAPNTESEYISSGDTDRGRFRRHPWSIGGGGASELKERLDTISMVRLEAYVDSVGFASFPGTDEAFIAPPASLRRAAISQAMPLSKGEVIRDWRIEPAEAAVTPYDDHFEELPLDPHAPWFKHLWPNRTVLQSTISFGGKTRAELGDNWWAWYRWIPEKYREPLSIAFASVATHNHFVVDRGGSVFKQSAPVIKLKSPNEDDYFRIVAALNSGTACFWMQQVFHNKGASVDSKGARQTTVAWDNFFDHDGTKLRQFPLPQGQLPLAIARQIDVFATKLTQSQPSTLCASGVPTRLRLDEARVHGDQVFQHMVALQEEMDWEFLHLHRLSEEPLTVPAGKEPPPLKLGERAFEIILARQVAAGEVETAWFTRHRSTPITELPAHWPGWYRDLVQRRIDLIESDRDVALIERPEHKRRWAREPWEKLEAEALQSWLFNRLEDRRLWFEGSGDNERAVCRSIAQLADRIVALDPDFLDVARPWKGAVEIDPVKVIAELVADEHVPAQTAARYKPKGLEKRRVWERTWDLQRIEDRGEPLPDGLTRIPVPPKYASTDFQKASYWRQRGKLDVPKERFISIAGAERDADSTLVLTWAGFDHAQQAQAIATLAYDRQNTDGWNPERTWPITVALIELLPWLDQWHHQTDPRWGDSPANQYRNIAEQLAHNAGHTLADATTWAPATKPKKPKDEP